MRATSPILSDAWFMATEEEYERICQNSLVSEAAMGIRIGSMMDPSGAGELLLFDADEKMAQWMRYDPTEGSMPEKGNEIVVSDQYLRDLELAYEADMSIELTYFIADEEYTDTFTIVGIYDKEAVQPFHAVLTSDEFYRDICKRLEQNGIRPEDATYQIVGVMFASRGNVTRLVSMLVKEEELDLEKGQIFLNDISLFDSVGAGTFPHCLWVMLLLPPYCPAF